MVKSSLLRQYEAQKALHPDSILFFRMGDFYEMYGEDASLVSRELSLSLGSRPLRGGERLPLCGVPSHAAEGHIRSLVTKGYRVAVCEQQAGAGGKVLERRVVRVVTPGMILDSEMLDPKRNNYIASAYLGAEGAGFAAADISTGVLYSAECTGEDGEGALLRELGCYAPKETLLSPAAARNRLWGFLRDRLYSLVKVCGEEDFSFKTAQERAKRAWPGQSAEALGFGGKPFALRAVGAILGYLEETAAGGDLPPLSPYVYERGQFLQLDPVAREDLELCETKRQGVKKGSLLGLLDETVTAAGGRNLRSWLEKPLLSPAEIGARHGAVQCLLEEEALRQNLREVLQTLPDMERILLRVVTGRLRSADELRDLLSSFFCLPRLRALLEGNGDRMLTEIQEALDDLPELRDALKAAFGAGEDREEGRLFTEGYDAAFDAAYNEWEDCRAAFDALEREERARSGVKSLKLGRNKQYGWFFEWPKSRAGKLPPDYEARQSLSGHERFVSPALRALEARFLMAEGERSRLEGELTERLRFLCAAQTHRIQRTSQAAARLDTLCSFAETAERYGYVRPEVDYSYALRIQGGRHPIVERVKGVDFVPNDTVLDTDCATALITGPNMAGKSTYLRQCALIVILGQAGSFVPAVKARIGVVDRVFTRTGASDDIAGGRSTFMTEMQEAAEILKNATRRSLLILDEIGRGTSTYDGMSVARAVLEYAHGSIGAKTLFATHYRELCELAALMPGVCNYHISAEKKDGEIHFSRKLLPGMAEGSFGVEVAALAGLPERVVLRAHEVLASLEKGETPGGTATGESAVSYADCPALLSEGTPDDGSPALPSGDTVSAGNTAPGFDSLERDAALRLLDVVRSLDPDSMTPLQALQTLYRIKGMSVYENPAPYAEEADVPCPGEVLPEKP